MGSLAGRQTLNSVAAALKKHYGIVTKRVVFLVNPPLVLRCEPFSERRTACKTKEHDVRTKGSRQ